MQNNDVIRGKVVEVGQQTIRYHKADNPDGPLYDLAASDIYMIAYANGHSNVITPRGSAPAQADNQAPPAQITTAPPPMPTYDQPLCPTEGFIWTPGYWAYGPAGYYWVPGVWVAPPRHNLLWTPGYWGFGGGYYGWHEGYWGETVGYYGGVYYGYGYEGHGFYGGHWDGGYYRYNTAVTHVNMTVVHNTYVDNTVVVNNTTVNHSSFNGEGGVKANPTPEEQKVAVQPHVNATPEQVAHVQTAQSDKSQYASVNGGKPAVASMNKTNGQHFTATGSLTTPHPNSQPLPQAQHPAGSPAATQPAHNQAPPAQPHQQPATPAAPQQQHAAPVQPQPAQQHTPAPVQQQPATGAKPGTTNPQKPVKPAAKPAPKKAQQTEPVKK